MGFMTENSAKKEKNWMDKVEMTGYSYMPLQSLSSLLVLSSQLFIHLSSLMPHMYPHRPPKSAF